MRDTRERVDGQELGIRKRWTARALTRMRGHDWKGNAAELRSAVQQAFLAPATELDESALPLEREIQVSGVPRFEVRGGLLDPGRRTPPDRRDAAGVPR